MNERTAPRSIEQYLAALRASLAGEDPALVQDALYDAEEYLRAEVAANSGRTEADTLELIASTYGAPEEVAAAYRTTEKQVRTALAPAPRTPARTAFGRFFSVYGDARTVGPAVRHRGEHPGGQLAELRFERGVFDEQSNDAAHCKKAPG